MLRGFLKGDLKALKAEDGVLHGEVSKDRVVSRMLFYWIWSQQDSRIFFMVYVR